MPSMRTRVHVQRVASQNVSSDQQQQHQLPQAVELTEARLRELATTLRPSSDGGGSDLVRRCAMRVPVQGFVHIVALDRSGGAVKAPLRRVGVYDLSSTGIALVDMQPMAQGAKFKVMFPRDFGPPIEMMCTARHSRKHGEQA